MRYSVFNQSLGTYSVYEGPQILKRLTTGGSTALGSAPEDTTDILPSESQYLGESEFAEGKIVEISYGFNNFCFTFFAILTASVFGRWAYDRFFK
jgi:hypothetical protein